ncbi:hypothetical protein CEXT_99671 [Caerostris extrusa]|uniref:Uncharacterized protein n=1 Tax=Caerostris extrusa TaxID=172846 RepID=A0AAV4SWJ8_CAEEX|nr:hypothetical protein CEXT_99671 [Caerostris extrusa]
MGHRWPISLSSYFATTPQVCHLEVPILFLESIERRFHPINLKRNNTKRIREKRQRIIEQRQRMFQFGFACRISYSTVNVLSTIPHYISFYNLCQHKNVVRN